jgi:hypothetical protein
MLSRSTAKIDVIMVDADALEQERHRSDRHESHVIPEYRPDAYDLTGIRVHASTGRNLRPEGSRWTWELRFRGSFTIHDNMIAEMLP